MPSEQKHGVWWYGEGETEYGGHLNIPDEGWPILELTGRFEEDLTDLDPIRTIHGETTDGDQVLLSQCVPVSLEGTPQTRNKKFRVSRVLSGPKRPESENPELDAVTAKLTNLGSWLDQTGFSTTVTGEADVDIQYTRPDSVRIPLDNGLEIIFGQSYSQSAGGISVREQSVVQEAFVQIKPGEEPLKYTEYWDYLRRIRAFLSIAIGIPVYTKEVKGRIPAGDEHPMDFVDIQIYEPRPQSVDDIPEKTSHEMRFTIEKIEHQIEEILNAWMDIRDHLEPVYELLVGTMYRQEMFPIHEFLSLTQGLEVFHRRTHDDWKIPPEDHKKRVKTVLESVPSDHKEWVNNQLYFWGNKPSLKDRLIELYEDNQKVLSTVFDDPEDIITTIKDTRHYYTHYGEDKKDQAAEGVELHHLIDRSRAFLLTALLKEVGLNGLFILSVAEDSVERREYIEWNAES